MYDLFLLRVTPLIFVVFTLMGTSHFYRKYTFSIPACVCISFKHKKLQIDSSEVGLLQNLSLCCWC